MRLKGPKDKRRLKRDERGYYGAVIMVVVSSTGV